MLKGVHVEKYKQTEKELVILLYHCVVLTCALCWLFDKLERLSWLPCDVNVKR